MNASYLAELFAFAVILFLIYRYVVPPMRKAMRRRQEAIGAQFAEAREAKQAAEAAEAKYRASIRDARAEVDELRRSARAQAEQILDELRGRAQEESQRIAERGRQQLVAERDSVVNELRAEMGTLAVELADRIVHETLTDQTRRTATVERVLRELEAGDESAAESAASEQRNVRSAAGGGTT